MSEVKLTGGCLCGAVRYEVVGKPTRFYHCHCARCRKATGTGHASNLFLQPAALTWLSGEGQITCFKVPEAKRFANTFCKGCGGRLPRQTPDSDVVVIPAGSLDDEAPIKPQANIFTGSRAQWSCQTEALPAYQEYPPR